MHGLLNLSYAACMRNVSSGRSSLAGVLKGRLRPMACKSLHVKLCCALGGVEEENASCTQV